MKFYEVQQKTGYTWTGVGYFTDKKNAEMYTKEFNTAVLVAEVRIVERNTLDEMYKEKE